ncbi:MAG: hypothetical protein AB7S78_11925 [Candidatus Omnitrophota bacterium]
MDLLSVTLYLLIPTTLGYFLVTLLSWKTPLPFFVKFMLGYGIGAGLLTHWAVILSYFKIPFCAVSINVPILAVTLLLFCLIARIKNKPNLKLLKYKLKFDTINSIFLLFSIYIICFIFWSGTNIPISEWDTYSTLGLKAKTIYYDKSLNYLPYIGKFNYPIHLELMLAWLSSCLGYWDNTVIKFVFPMSCLAYLVIQYYFLRHFTSARWALFSIVLLLSSAFVVYHSYISYRDITMMFYNCTAILLIILWYSQKQNMYLVLGALFSGMTSFIKLEGFGYLGIHNLLVWMLMYYINFIDTKKKTKLTILFGTISFGMYALFMFYRKLYILPFVPPELLNSEHFNLSHLTLNLSADTLFRIKIVMRRYITNFYLTGNWSLVWLFFLISVLQISNKRISMEIKAFFFVLGLFFVVYLFSYIFTQHYLWVAFKADVLSRSLLHIFPLITILIPLLNVPEEVN